MSDELFARVAGRLQYMLKSRDHRAVREVAALVDTRALEALVEHDPPDLIAQHLLGWTYWFTAQASAGEREALRQRAVEAFAITLYAGLGEFPEPLVGDIVDQAVHDIEPLVLTDEQVLDADDAVAFFTRVLAMFPQGSVGRPVRHFLLGVALWRKYEASHDAAASAGASPRLDAAVAQFGLAFPGLPPTDRYAAVCLTFWARALQERHSRLGDPSDLHAAVPLLRKAIEAGDGDAQLPQRLAVLAQVLASLAPSTGPGHFTEALALMRRAADLTADDTRQQLPFLLELVRLHTLHTVERQTLRRADALIDSLEEALAHCELVEPRRTALHWLLANALLGRCRAVASVDDLNRAVDLLRTLARTPGLDDSTADEVRRELRRAARLKPGVEADAAARDAANERAAAAEGGDPARLAVEVARVAWHRWKETREEHDLQEAIRSWEHAADTVDPADADHPECVMSHSKLVFEATVEEVAGHSVHRAVATALRAARSFPAGDAERVMHLFEVLVLAAKEGGPSDRTALVTELAEAVPEVPSNEHRQALDETKAEWQAQPLVAAFVVLRHVWDVTFAIPVMYRCLDLLRDLARRAEGTDGADLAGHALAQMMAEGAHRTGDPDLLEESLTILRTLDPGSPLNRLALASALRERHELTHDIPALDEAAAILDAARQDAALDASGMRAECCCLLATVLRQKYEQSGDVRHVSEAVAAAREAVDLTPAGARFRARYQSALGAALRAQAEATGDIRLLDEAIGEQQDAARFTADPPTLRGQRLHGLAMMLYLRHAWYGDTSSLEEAARVSREAVDVAPPEAPAHSRNLVGLSGVLTALARHRGQDERGELWDEAVRAAQRAVDLTPPDHLEYGHRLGELAEIAYRRARAENDEAAATGALEQARLAAGAGSGDWFTRTRIAAHMGALLYQEFLKTRDAALLSESAEVLRQAKEVTPAEHPWAADIRTTLARVLLSRHAGTEQPQDAVLLEAAGHCREAAENRNAPPDVRGEAALLWAELSAVRADWPTAVRAYALATELRSRLTDRTLRRTDRERHLAQWPWLPTDAAASAVASGDLPRAVELLESARGVLMGQTLDMRGERAKLRDEHPRLAAQLLRLEEEIERLGHRGDPASGDLVDYAEARLLQNRVRAWEEKRDEIRRLDGYGDFLVPPSYASLREAAREGPVVLVNISRYRSDALIMTEEELHHVELPLATPEQVHRAASSFHNARGYGNDASRSAEERRGAANHLFHVLDWVWRAVTEPVLRLLRDKEYLTDGHRPRLWWCPTGPLALLPLHAAGTGMAGESVLDHVVSSYTPTVRALLHARRESHEAPHAADAGAGPAVLMVAVGGDAHGHDTAELEVQEDVAEIRAHCPDLTELLGEQAHRAAVLAALPHHQVAYFACHGRSDPESPSHAALTLYDGPLTVLDVARLRLPKGKLAVLAACGTGRPTEHLADEAIHVSSAFQLAGYDEVLATLWEVPDAVAVDIAANVTTAVRTGGAHACHSLVEELRDAYPGQVGLWAAYIHTGV